MTTKFNAMQMLFARLGEAVYTSNDPLRVSRAKDQIDKAKAMLCTGPHCPECKSSKELSITRSYIHYFDPDTGKVDKTGELTDDGVFCHNCGTEHPEPQLFLLLFVEDQDDE